MGLITIDPTAFILSGIKRLMYNDPETEYVNEEREGQSEREWAGFGDWANAQGYGMSLMPDGTMKRYSRIWIKPEDKMPLPTKPIEGATEKRLNQRWLEKRIRDSAEATPEVQWLRQAKYRFALDLNSYDPKKGTVVLRFKDRAKALLFKNAN